MLHRQTRGHRRALLVPGNDEAVTADLPKIGVRLLAFVRHRLRLLVFPARTYGVHPQAEREISRFPPKSFRTMSGSPTTPGRASARGNALARVAFRVVNRVGSRVNPVFAAQWLACALPYRRFAVILADADARLGVDAGRYSFIAMDFHHLLFAGLTGAPTIWMRTAAATPLTTIVARQFGTLLAFAARCVRQKVKSGARASTHILQALRTSWERRSAA